MNEQFSYQSSVKDRLRPNLLTLDDLRIYLNMIFPSRREIAISAQISVGRVDQILTGYGLPQTPQFVYRIAKGWGIDPVVLTLLFERERSAKKESVPKIITADGLEEEHDDDVSPQSKREVEVTHGTTT